MHLNTYIIAAITGLTGLQPLKDWSKEDGFLYEYIAAFPYMHAMQDVVWFISEELNGLEKQRANKLVKDLGNFTHLTQFVWTQLRDVRMIKIQSKRGHIVVLVTTGVEDPIMLAHHRHLIGRHYSLTYLVYVRQVTDMRPIKEFCYLLYERSFVNSVVYFQTSEGLEQVYSMEKFPKFKMINSTDYKEYYREMKQRIGSASQDVRGYKFRTPLKQDIPNVLRFKNEMGATIFQGTSYSLLKTFIRTINGSLEIYEHNGSQISDIIDMHEVLELLRLKDIDISAHAYALFQPDDDLDKSYPLMVVKWCLMVPLNNKISTFFYTLQPFEGNVWFLIVIALMALCLKDLICKKWKCKRRYNSFWLNNFCHILNISPARSITITHLSSFLYHVSIFFLGFFLCAFYTSFLGSFLTVSLFRAQINNLKDLISANLSVMIIDYELDFLMQEGYEAPQDFIKLLRPVNSSTFYEHQISLNTSYAYFITDDRWQFLHECQKHLKHRPFKFSDICFGTYHLAYPMQTDSPIWRDLEYFLLHLHASGLFQMYERKALIYAFKWGLLKRLEKSKSYTSAGLEHLRLVFYILITMYVVSLGCLIMEILYFKHKNNSLRKFS